MNEETITVHCGRAPVRVNSIVGEHLGLKDGQAILPSVLEDIVRSNNALIRARDIMLHANMAVLLDREPPL